MNKIIGNLVGTTLPRIQVDEVLDANSNNAVANKVVAEIAQTQEQSLGYFGSAIDNHEERITITEEQCSNLDALIEQNEIACLEGLADHKERLDGLSTDIGIITPRLDKVEEDMGNIDIALENIIAIQNSLIGGGSV